MSCCAKQRGERSDPRQAVEASIPSESCPVTVVRRKLARWFALIPLEFSSFPNMSRCLNCRHEVSGLTTLCDVCFEKQYDEVKLSKSPWQRRRFLHRPRLRLSVVYAFLLFFPLYFLRRRFITSFPLTTAHAAWIALVSALIVAFVESTRKVTGQDSQQKK